MTQYIPSPLLLKDYRLGYSMDCQLSCLVPNDEQGKRTWDQQHKRHNFKLFKPIVKKIEKFKDMRENHVKIFREIIQREIDKNIVEFFVKLEQLKSDMNVKLNQMLFEEESCFGVDEDFMNVYAGRLVSKEMKEKMLQFKQAKLERLTCRDVYQIESAIRMLNQKGEQQFMENYTKKMDEFKKYVQKEMRNVRLNYEHYTERQMQEIRSQLLMNQGFSQNNVSGGDLSFMSEDDRNDYSKMNEFMVERGSPELVVLNPRKKREQQRSEQKDKQSVIESKLSNSSDVSVPFESVDDSRSMKDSNVQEEKQEKNLFRQQQQLRNFSKKNKIEPKKQQQPANIKKKIIIVGISDIKPVKKQSSQRILPANLLEQQKKQKKGSNKYNFDDIAQLKKQKQKQNELSVDHSMVMLLDVMNKIMQTDNNDEGFYSSGDQNQESQEEEDRPNKQMVKRPSQEQGVDLTKYMFGHLSEEQNLRRALEISKQQHEKSYSTQSSQRSRRNPIKRGKIQTLQIADIAANRVKIFQEKIRFDIVVRVKSLVEINVFRPRVPKQKQAEFFRLKFIGADQTGIGVINVPYNKNIESGSIITFTNCSLWASNGGYEIQTFNPKITQMKANHRMNEPREGTQVVLSHVKPNSKGIIKWIYEGPTMYHFRLSTAINYHIRQRMSQTLCKSKLFLVCVLQKLDEQYFIIGDYSGKMMMNLDRKHRQYDIREGDTVRIFSGIIGEMTSMMTPKGRYRLPSYELKTSHESCLVLNERKRGKDIQFHTNQIPEFGLQ